MSFFVADRSTYLSAYQIEPKKADFRRSKERKSRQCMPKLTYPSPTTLSQGQRQQTHLRIKIERTVLIVICETNRGKIMLRNLIYTKTL